MADISFNIACKELKLAQIAQLNQLFKLLHLVHIYGDGFYELSRMLMKKNVNKDVSKDSLVAWPDRRVMICRLVSFSADLRRGEKNGLGPIAQSPIKLILD